MSKRSILVAAVLALLACAGMAYFIWTQFDPSAKPAAVAPDGSTAVLSNTHGATDPRDRSAGAAGRKAGDPGDPGDPVSKTIAESKADAHSPSSATPVVPTPPGTGVLVALVDDEDGNPIPGVEIEAISDRSAFKAITGPKGNVEFERLPASSYEVRLSAETRPLMRAKRRHLVRPGERTELRVVLRAPEHAISGRVLNQQGEPAPEVELRCSPLDRDDGTMTLLPVTATRVVTRAEGRFEFTGLEAGEYLVETVPSAGFAIARVNVMAPAVDVDIVVYDERRVEFTGVVIDDAKRPLAGAVVSPTSLVGRTSTDENGAYRLVVPFRDAGGATIVLTAERPGYSTEQKSVKVDGATDGATDGESVPVMEIDFTLEPIADAATLAGRLIDTEGNPVPGERISLRSASLNIRRNAVSDRRGDFTMKNLRAGTDYRLQIYPRSGFKDFRETDFTLSEGENEVEIELEAVAEGELAGRLVDASGAPLPSFSFHVRSRQSLANSLTVTTDSTGRFDAIVPAGQLILETRTFPKITVHGVTVGADKRSEVEVPIGVGDESVRGVVETKLETVGVNEALAGARVIITWTKAAGALRSTVYHEAVTDERGRFTASGFGAGECSASVTMPGHRSKRVRFKIEANRETPELKVLLLPLETTR